MENYLVQFYDIPWDYPRTGVKQKIFSSDNRQMRLVEFNENFVEAEWCSKGHIGYVLEGSMQIDFSGKIYSYVKGDGLWIEGGDVSKHKVQIKAGEFVRLLLFEKYKENQ